MLQPPSNLAVLPQDIEFLERVGKGGFGEVFRAKWNGKGGGDIVAVKKVQIITTNQKVLQEIYREVDILTKLRHRNILQIYGACFLETQELWIVLEFMEGGSLYDLLHSEKPLGWDIRARLALQAAKAVNLLHSNDPCILHRDIKSLNFLISKDAVGQFQLKLTDFGMSKVKVNSVASFTEGGIGSCRWAAPETLATVPQWTEKADIYSLGLTFYEIASRKIPFEKVDENIVVLHLVEKNKRPDIPNDCPPEFAEIIHKCWDPDPNARPTTAQLLQMLESFVAKYSALNQVPKAKPPQVFKPTPTLPPPSPKELFVAALAGDIERIREITENYAMNPNVTDEKKQTPLFYAARTGHADAIRELIRVGANPNAIADFLETPLQTAVHYGNLEAVEELIKHGANVNAKNENAASSLYTCGYYGYPEIARVLLQNGAKVDSGQWAPLWIAADHGHAEVVGILASFGANVDVIRTGETPLFTAAKEGYLPVVQELVSHGAKVNKAQRDGTTPLWIAAQEGHLGVVNILLSEGAQVELTNGSGKTPREIALEKGHTKVAAAIAEREKEIQKRKRK